MELIVPSVAPSAPRIQKQSEKPGDGADSVPIMPYMLRAEEANWKALEVSDGIDTPEKLLPPELSK